MPDILWAYLITFGWAITASAGMALGLGLALKIFDLMTPKVDEWKRISEGNIAMGMVISAFIVSVGWVIAGAVR